MAEHSRGQGNERISPIDSDELIDEAGMESFPASDPPATWSGEDPRDVNMDRMDGRNWSPRSVSRVAYRMVPRGAHPSDCHVGTTDRLSATFPRCSPMLPPSTASSPSTGTYASESQPSRSRVAAKSEGPEPAPRGCRADPWCGASRRRLVIASQPGTDSMQPQAPNSGL
jgi:hypothetical protein